uniref:Uncharacterized protein AlNc14C53G4099 n=1 Tax=Albugo laibachii Nc14 TaxID=890382 RepID=F0WBQ8_9STRA|nr:conserved hypothetical protein [Albugo laibachii Nc14]CCA20542.1 conserved hypothetical protein [Albugo laibachii Nc14]|eukprot:CCA20542.1 conserved hypothetical protein [Albugo laibachii Nc14]
MIEDGRLPKERAGTVILLPLLAQGFTRLYLCRHGQTDYNYTRKLQGRGINTILNDTGREQAANLAEATRDLPLTAIISSALARAQETAQIVANTHPNLCVQSFPELEEMSYGQFEGQGHEKHHGFHSIVKEWRFGHYDKRFPGGECPIDVIARGNPKIEDIMRQAAAQDHIMIVAHGRFNKIILSQCLYGNLEHMHEFEQENTCVNVLDYDRESQTYEEVVINSVKHLPRQLTSDDRQHQIALR